MVSATYEEQAVLFECAGEELVGIVTAPPSACDIGLLVIVGGPQYRIGGHRQFVLLARRLASSGIPVMRFDYRGMGDSSGASVTFEDAVPDIAGAIDAFIGACPSLKRVVLWGLCDAASASLLYWHATRDSRIAGMALADPWIFSDEAFAQSQMRHYFLRPFQREFWTKLMRGGIDLRGALKDVADVLLKAIKRDAATNPVERPFQERMTHAMDAYAGPLLLVLSGDLTAREFVQYCDAHREWHTLIARPSVERGDLPDANHTFATAASRAQVETLTIDWLNRKVLQ
jgi:exosortase A-associated hydrolase 1